MPDPSDRPESAETPKPSGEEDPSGESVASESEKLSKRPVGASPPRRDLAKGGDRLPAERPTVEELLLEEEGDPARRDFLQKAGSVVLGTAMVAAPVAVAIRAASSPVFSGKSDGILARLTTLDALVPGGPPQAFKVVADKSDAWTTYKNLPLGLVYAQRAADGAPTVFTASCPHAGCAVEYRKEGEVKGETMGEHYYCPCHESAFALDGEIASAGSPADRGMDTLQVDEEKLKEGEVWVRFQKFKAGVEDKIAIS